MKYGTDRKLSASSFHRWHWFRQNLGFESKTYIDNNFKFKSNQIMGKSRQIKSRDKKGVKSNQFIKKCVKSKGPKFHSNQMIIATEGCPLLYKPRDSRRPSVRPTVRPSRCVTPCHAECHAHWRS